MKIAKPAEYNLQISLGSLCSEQVLNIESTAPFNCMSIGEKYYPPGDTSNWFSDGPAPKVLYIVDIAHSVIETQTMVLNHVFVALSSEAPGRS